MVKVVSKRHLRFSLKSVFLFYLPITAVLALLASYGNYYREQHAIGRHFRSIGAHIHWDQGCVTELYVKGPTSPSDLGLLRPLNKLRRLSLAESGQTFGDEDLGVVAHLHSLEELHLESVDVTDDGLRSLSCPEDLSYLFISSAKVTGAGLEHFAQLPGLKTLTIGNNLTDAGLNHLAQFQNLETLSIGGEFTDEGLRGLCTLTHLKALSLGGAITRRGLRYLSCRKSLHRLDLSGSPIDAEGLLELRRFPNLDSVVLRGTRLREAEIDMLAAVPKLKWLDLTGASVNDDALAPIARMRSLEVLLLADTDITNQALEHLVSLPNLRTVDLHGTRATWHRAQELGLPRQRGRDF